ncbi:hypothetical protein ABZ557_15245 [Streptomyces sp. NPDC019645]
MVPVTVVPGGRVVITAFLLWPLALYQHASHAVRKLAAPHP